MKMSIIIAKLKLKYRFQDQSIKYDQVKSSDNNIAAKMFYIKASLNRLDCSCIIDELQ